MSIDEQELTLTFTRGTGPGGQNVNKVSTVVQLRFDVRQSSLPEGVKERLFHLAGPRITDQGILIIEARRFRAQGKNRQDAILRFKELMQKALEKPRSQKKTIPTRRSKERRLESKKHKGELKQTRRKNILEQ